MFHYVNVIIMCDITEVLEQGNVEFKCCGCTVYGQAYKLHSKTF